MVLEAINEALPGLDSTQGKIFWGLVVNRNIKIPNGEVISGSFRWWGARIAEAVGDGDYLDYYMSSGFLKMILEVVEPGKYEKMEKELQEKLENSGWEFIENIVICGDCGKKISRFGIKGINLREGKTLCSDCLLQNKV